MGAAPTIDEAVKILNDIRGKLDAILSNAKLSPNQIELQAISQLCTNLGVFQAGEFRSPGEPGNNFSGVRILPSGIMVYNNDNVTGYIQQDGDVFFGSDTSAPGTTGFVIFSNDQTYNGEVVGAGDVLIGDNSSGKGNIFWDNSLGTLFARSGTVVMNKISSGSLLPVGCRASRLNTQQTIPTATATAIQFDSVQHDDSSFINLGTNNKRITIPTGLTGVYLVPVYVAFTPVAGGTRKVAVSFNCEDASTIMAVLNIPSAGAVLNTDVCFTGWGAAAAGDYLALTVYQDSGSDVNCTAYFGAIKMR